MSEPNTAEWRSVGKSHIGLVRTINEDAVLDYPDQDIWAVADGMGGHDAGDRASNCVVAELAKVSEAPSLSDFIDVTKGRLRAVNKSIRQEMSGESMMAGSTVVALLRRDTHVAVIWAGDSRAYLLREGYLKRLTEDHSRVQRLVRRGLIKQEEADHHPDSNIIARAIGVSEDVEFDTEILEAKIGDAFLLCSDGLYRSVDESEIVRCLELENCAEACQRLIGKAIDGGGDDNISAIVIHTRWPDEAGRNLATADLARTCDDLTVAAQTDLTAGPTTAVVGQPKT